MSAALEEHGEAFAAEMRALEEMPQVKLTPGSVFDRAQPPGSDARKRGVIIKLHCCGGQLDQKCNKLICPPCTHRDKTVWVQQVVRDLGTGLAGRRIEAKEAGKKLAQMLMRPSKATPKPNEGFLAIQARERWSTSEDVHYRPGHFWLAQLPGEREVRKIETRCTIEGVMFSAGDYLIRIGRFFDRVASDTSGLTFEEWTPPDESSFVVNATELYAVNFTMTPTTPPPPLMEVRRSGRRAAVVSTPPQKPHPRSSRWIVLWTTTFDRDAGREQL